MIQAILVDDEPASLETLQLKISKVSEEVAIQQAFQSPLDALEACARLKPDVIFLDVDMPEMDGFSFLEKIHCDTEVIFTTAYSEYAIQAIRHSAIDFLQKPIGLTELRGAIERLEQKLTEKRRVSASPKRLNAQFDKIPVPSMLGMKFLPIHDIVALTADSNYTTFHMVDKSKLVSSKTLGHYEKLIESIGFFRIHHSSIVNLSHIQEYRKGGDGGSVIMVDGTELDVAKRRKKDFMEATGSG